MTLAAVATTVLAMAGCGGGSDTTNQTGSTSSPPEERAAPEQQTGQAGGHREGGPAHSARPRGLNPADVQSLPNEGTKAVAPGVPTTHGGDNSIQAYGIESNGNERAQAAGALKSYLAALLGRDWNKACSLLATPTKEDLERLWVKATGGNGGPACQKAVAGFLAGLPQGQLRSLGDLHVLSMRIEGDRGFLIYDDAKGTVSESPMQREAGGWKVRTLIAKELLLSPATSE
jgi:hypothetical protein